MLCCAVLMFQDKDALRGHRHGSRERGLTSPRSDKAASGKDRKEAGDKKDEKKAEDKPAAAADEAKKEQDTKADGADAAAATDSKPDGEAAKPEAAAEGDKPADAAAAGADAEGKGDEKSEKKEMVKVEVEEKPCLQPSDPATWPQPEAGEVVDGIKWMAKVRAGRGGGDLATRGWWGMRGAVITVVDGIKWMAKVGVRDGTAGNEGCSLRPSREGGPACMYVAGWRLYVPGHVLLPGG